MLSSRNVRRSAVALGLIPALVAAAPQTLPVPGGQPVRIHGSEADARSLLDAELAFEHRAQTEGVARAMRDTMDPVDGLSFAGGEPARGADAIFQANGGNAPGGTLTWAPAEVFAAPTLGATWGHFTFTPPGKGGPVVHGKYVTVWRREDGTWKGVIDFGAPD